MAKLTHKERTKVVVTLKLTEEEAMHLAAMMSASHYKMLQGVLDPVWRVLDEHFESTDELSSQYNPIYEEYSAIRRENT